MEVLLSQDAFEISLSLPLRPLPALSGVLCFSITLELELSPFVVHSKYLFSWNFLFDVVW